MGRKERMQAAHASAVSANAPTKSSSSSSSCSASNSEQQSRLQSTREAASNRRSNKLKGSTGTYQFGQEPLPEEVARRGEKIEATLARAGTYKFNDNLVENLYLKDPEKPANSLGHLAPAPNPLAQNVNDPQTINLEREAKARGKTGGGGGGSSSGSKGRKEGSSAGVGSAGTELLPRSLSLDPWVKKQVVEQPKMPTVEEAEQLTALANQNQQSKDLTGSARMVAHIKVPKPLRKRLHASGGGSMMPDKSLQRLTTYSDLEYSLLRTDLHEPIKRTGSIEKFAEKHPYFRMGQRSRFQNNSARVAGLLHAGASENFPDWDTPIENYPGYPFKNQADGRSKSECRKFVGEDTFIAWDKPLISKPYARKNPEPPSELSLKSGQKPVLTDRTQPQYSNAFLDDVTSSVAGVGAGAGPGGA